MLPVWANWKQDNKNREYCGAIMDEIHRVHFQSDNWKSSLRQGKRCGLPYQNRAWLGAGLLYARKGSRVILGTAENQNSCGFVATWNDGMKADGVHVSILFWHWSEGKLCQFETLIQEIQPQEFNNPINKANYIYSIFVILKAFMLENI